MELKADYELHRERRAAILKDHPEITKLYGHDTRMAYYAAGIVASMLTLAWVCRNSFGLAAVLGFTVGPYLDAAVLVLIHEATHFLVFKSPSANRLLSIFTNMVMVAPLSEVFKQHHGAHHMNLGNPEKDVDVPYEVEIALVGRSAPAKMLWLALNMIILPARSLTKLPVYTDKFLILNWVVCLGFGATVAYLSLPSFMFLILSLLNSQGLHPANTRQVQRHVFNGDEKMRARTAGRPRTYSYYGAANLWSLNVGYHLEHHDFSRVPGTRLPELRRIAGEKWYPSGAAHCHRGLGELLNFVFNRNITLADFAR
ncbi:MAG: fatty acid desaturase-domain-containing protein [Monoraphidium minutum]|nr:MAG: fatty acid desaturase-domain-containing protein [Monoraphidium minutum]